MDRRRRKWYKEHQITNKHQTKMTTHKPTRPMGNRYRLRTAICHVSSKRYIVLVASLIFAVTAVNGYKYFQTKIPNGESVPHPCKPNYMWKGVGHTNVAGGGERNQFGKDFKEDGKTWTQALCQKDSDNDGKTNGEELGDPNCVWTEGGGAPEITVGLSHPGICDPFDSEQCRGRNTWVDCSSQEFKCNALERENSDDLMNVTIRFKPTQVPPTETNYYCMTFDLNLTAEYHMIATEPVIDNEYVMHHIVLFGCAGSDGKLYCF
ncbi:hypothetical protein FSP39_016225 [Pinctada imbricata]|uniref:Temptin n=1 Tax=Pinctada imbricata TaxID=66713 RepID=A0AA88XVA2_PINIB|nr:hypothetical protein FSP39_016225 [Pinctada imbricata]